ncbi:hypothetical protein BDD26_0372 [Xenorhabdus cabanillasii]|uniref:Transcriptional regulator with AbiEi antitoxin domain of type IV toxin-antitoxin system n=1 Tax=Xenorhabdus cabanillasii TaxID=351673 RepID=A0A3D9UIK6_9GAMM|nr:type IV toxin-antitoxin system AbiEi family antitoxin [Xenorhabdus cabanillasii]REF25834.1 hypothetical protein BDD26_0372 [Xenorhabdus cabanillasii]
MPEEKFLSEITANLPAGFQLQYELEPQYNIGSWQPDGYAKLLSPDGNTFSFVLAVKKIHRKETLITANEQATRYFSDTPSLLLCNYLTPALTKYCASHNLNFIDTAGNARISVPGLYLSIEGKKSKNNIQIKSKVSIGTLKLLFILLSAPETLNETYRSLSELAGISLGMVSKSFEFLENRRYYRRTKNGRRLMRIEELQMLWLREYATILRPKLSYIPLKSIHSWEDISLKSMEYWGGEVAAAILSNGYFIPENWQLFTPYPLQQRRMELNLHPNRDGKLRLTSAFWGNAFQLNHTAQTMLCVAELLASLDERNLEMARFINGKYLHLNESTLFSY